MGIMKLKSWMSFALLIFLLAIMACEGSSGSGYPYSGIFFSNNYDTGTTPVVAGVEKTNIIIEVHDSPEYDLYYHVATADLANNRVNWGPSHVMGISGGNPSVAVSETGVVAEAHEVLGVNSNTVIKLAGAQHSKWAIPCITLQFVLPGTAKRQFSFIRTMMQLTAQQ
jgi:hypothetical protein